MWWIVLLIIASMLFTRLDDLIELYRSRNPKYQKAQEQRQLERKHQKIKHAQQLKSLIGSNCLLKSEQLIYMAVSSSEIQAKIIAVDSEWVEISTFKKKKERKMLLKIEHISRISKIL